MVFHWQDASGAWQLARKVELINGSGWRSYANGITACGIAWEHEVFVQHLYTGILEWVPEPLLRPYPSEKIEEPTK